MTLSTQAAAAKARLDAELGTSTDLIDVKFGSALYAELWRCGMLPWLPYNRIILPGAFQFPSYGFGRFAIEDPDLDPYDYRVGDGGVKV